MESKVFAILKKVSKPAKTELSLTDDLQKWNDFNSIDQLAFYELRNVETKISEASIALDDFEDANALAEESYEESYLNSDDLRRRLSEAIDLLGNFEVLAEELGIDPNTNEAYLLVKEQTITDYPELLELAEEVEQKANRYFSRTDGI